MILATQCNFSTRECWFTQCGSATTHWVNRHYFTMYIWDVNHTRKTLCDILNSEDIKKSIIRDSCKWPSSELFESSRMTTPNFKDVYFSNVDLDAYGISTINVASFYTHLFLVHPQCCKLSPQWNIISLSLISWARPTLDDHWWPQATLCLTYLLSQRQYSYLLDKWTNWTEKHINCECFKC